MAEEEKIMAHAKKAVQSLTNKNKKWKEKVKDFLFEILIIIVAVNITLWFHNWSDKKHERQQEKEFLIETRNDLIQIDSSLVQGIRVFQPTLNYYDSAIVQLDSNKINAQYLDTNANFLLNSSVLFYDDSRFESFKSSGYLRLIENQELLSHISQIYISYLPFITNYDKTLFDLRRVDYKNVIGNKTGYFPFTHAVLVSKFIHQPDVQYHIRYYGNWLNETKGQKQEIIAAVENVIKEIDKELKDRFNYDVSSKK